MAELNKKEELFGVITTNETIEGNINPSGKIVASMIAPKGAKGDPGVTPTIGENGNWYLGDTDTGKPSELQLKNLDMIIREIGYWAKQCE